MCTHYYSTVIEIDDCFLMSSDIIIVFLCIKIYSLVFCFSEKEVDLVLGVCSGLYMYKKRKSYTDSHRICLNGNWLT